MSDQGPVAGFESIATASPDDGRLKPMYGSYFGLTEAPFDLTPNPRFVLMTKQHREALANIRYALTSSKGFTLVLGDAGTGKTTLVRTALEGLDQSVSRFAVLSNPTLTKREFYEFLVREFVLSADALTSKTRLLDELQRQAEQRHLAGGTTGLVIDEAQSLPHELLEEVRLLGNIETSSAKLLSVVLCGQPELADRLNDPSLRQLKQRIALRCDVRSLTLSETASYVSQRLRIAGGQPATIFTREAVVAIYEGSRGIPRIINVICDNALVGAFGAQVKPVPEDMVKEVIVDFDLAAAAESSWPVRGAGRPDAAPSEPATAEAPPSGTAWKREMFSNSAPPVRRRFSYFSS